MRLKPGSTPWLLRHEARLKYRALSGRSRAWTLGLLGLLCLGLMAAGAPLGLLLDRVEFEPSRKVLLYTSAGLLLTFTLMLSQTLFSSAQAFYARRDLDLLLSSPLPASRILRARCLALAGNASLIPLILVTPPALSIAVLGHPEWLSAPVLVGGLGLGAATLGLWLAMGLFAVIGPRRTRTVSQVLSAFAGAAFFLGSQARHWLPEAQREAFLARVNAFSASPAFDAGSPLIWPARALLGQAGPAATVFAASALAFFVTTGVLGRRFAHNAAAGAGREAGSRRARGTAGGFSRGPFRATVRKELRLLARDPALMSQVLLRLLYIVPLLLLLVRDSDGPGGALAPLAAGVAFMTSALAAILTWVTNSTEDAPDLLACSPSKPGLLCRAKLTAALAPVALLLCIPVTLFMLRDPEAGLVLALCCAGAALCAGLITLWLGRPAKRAEFNARRRGSWLTSVVQTLVGACWAGAAWMGVSTGVLWMLAPAGLAIAVTAVLRRPPPQYTYA